ncbi:uncharacterized protein LOC115724971 [Cannabis sativa]|uniref:uncharacterized protein LOC115724971 n=1 Tax=Cannabis sativa TaxID=3483 RepID=UPI0029CA3C07|nr:uncharacterized protein LOC115724971 [Cannabis sativa]
MALKLDMAKAFDRVEWVFIHRVMEKFSFPQRFIDLVLACVSSATFSFSINQQVLGHIKPSRGIRQGDPLSPYLFLLCSEGLSTLIHLKTQQPQPHRHSLGIKISRRAPAISYLFFADDSLLFSPASPEAGTTIKTILTDYSSAFGQMVNFTKSALFFSPNTTNEIKNNVATILGIPVRDSFDKYLGLPQTFGRTKKEAFNYIRDRVLSHLNKWNSKIFSKGGKEVLLKSVVQAIPSYVMACFKLPASFHYKLESMMARFWCGGTEHNRKIHWKQWSFLCRSKFHGGLGFCSMKAFNQAIFLDAGKGHRPSLVWTSITSITWGEEVLQSGLRRSIGDCTTISIFNDAWIPGYGKLHYLRHHSAANMTVSYLLTPTKDWNLALIQATFREDVSQAILTTPLSNLPTPDAYYWSFTSHGTYTIWNCRNSWLHAGLSSLPVQLSVDAAQDVQQHKMGFGMSIQTNKGEVLLNLAMPWSGIHPPLLMEAHALYFALSWCHAHSFYPDSIVSDCKVLVDYICNNDTHNLHLNSSVIEIKSLLSYFPKAFISYIQRGANEAAHCLPRKALGLDQEALWKSCSLHLSPPPLTLLLLLPLDRNLDRVASEHELADYKASNARSGPNDENCGVLGTRNGKLAHGSFPNEKSIECSPLVCSASARNLAQSRELMPNLIEQLTGSATQSDKIHILKIQTKLLLLMLFLSNNTSSRSSCCRRRRRRRKGLLSLVMILGFFLSFLFLILFLLLGGLLLPEVSGEE